MEMTRYFKTSAARFAASLRTTLAIVMALTPTLAMANPEGGVVVGGNATIVSTPSELQIHQSTNSALIEWNGFNINNGETTHFYQPGASSIAVNRVVNSQQISQINGNLVANGKVVVINPNGVIIGPNGNVDTASFLATSADIDNNAVMQGGTLNFNRAGKADAVVENQGKITVKQEGLAALVAPTVRNSGIIQGNLAKVQTAAADTFAVDFYGDGLVQFAVEPAAGDTKRTLKNENTGTIIADGGQVLMTAAAASNIVDSVINNEGVIQAASLENHNGKIVLTGEGATVNVAGKLDASGQGNADGGQILVGGDFQGQGTLAHAKTVNIADTAELKADAGTTGNGGKIVAWSDSKTTSRGSFSAQGGTQSGNGGMVETSSPELLDVDGTQVNTLAANGDAGYWLLDPTNINVVASGATGSDVNVATLNNAFTNVILAATNSINFNTDVNMTHSGVGLTALAGTGTTFLDPLAINLGLWSVQAGSGNINLLNHYIRTNGGDVNFLAGDTLKINNATIYTRGGDFNGVAGNIDINHTNVSTAGGDINLTAEHVTQWVLGKHGWNLEDVTPGTLQTQNSNYNTTGGHSFGSLGITEDGSNRTYSQIGNSNSYAHDKKGGDITITAEDIKNSNSNCFAAGSASCGITDPYQQLIAITVMADYLSKIYGNADPLLTYTYTGTLAAGDSFTGGLTRAAGENVGHYAINQGTLSISGSSGLTYTIAYVSNILDILKAQLIVNALNQSKVYGSTGIDGSQYTVSGLKFSDTVTSVDLNSTGAAANATVAGSPYAINASNAVGTSTYGAVSLDHNYDITYNTGQLTVTPKALTITADDRTKTYGDTVVFAGTEFTTNGLVNGDTIGHVDLASGGAAATANAGTYAINGSNATGTGLGNYDISYAPGLLTINKAGLIITADDQTKTYGNWFLFNGTEFTTSGLVNNDKVWLVGLGSLGQLPGANVGNYDIYLGGALGKGLSNYDISYVKGTLTVDPRALTIAATDQSKVYGDTFTFDGTNPGDFTVTGLVNGDKVKTVDLSSDGAPGTATVGAYDIDIGNAHGKGLSNYDITYNNGTLTVTPKTLHVLIDDQSKVYGNTFTFNGSEFSYNPAELVNGDQLTSLVLHSDGAPATANVGGYAIDALSAAGTGLSNYNIAYTPGTLFVNPANLLIIANNDTKTFNGIPYSGGNGVTYVGFKNGDTAESLGFDIGYGGNSQGAVNPGKYDITPFADFGSNSGGDGEFAKVAAVNFGNPNYNVSFASGLLTINAQANTPRITFDPLGRPIISVANQAIVLDAPFESIDVANTNTNVSIAANNTPPVNLASIEPGAGPSDNDLANIEPAAGPGGGETSQEVACGNNFLGNHPCDSNANY